MFPSPSFPYNKCITIAYYIMSQYWDIIVEAKKNLFFFLLRNKSQKQLLCQYLLLSSTHILHNTFLCHSKYKRSQKLSGSFYWNPSPETWSDELVVSHDHAPKVLKTSPPVPTSSLHSEVARDFKINEVDLYFNIKFSKILPQLTQAYSMQSICAL